MDIFGRVIPLIHKFGTFKVARVVNPNECIYCARCESACPFQAIQVDKNSGILIDTKRCIGCGHCEKVCKAHVIKLYAQNTKGFGKKERVHNMRTHVTGHRHSHKHLIKAIRDTSRKPSPGSVYPLRGMVNKDLIVKKEDERHELTETGYKQGYDTVYNTSGHKSPQEEEMDRGTQTIDVLTEIDSYISYLEDIRKEELIPHEEMLEILNKKLKNLKKSLYEE